MERFFTILDLGIATINKTIAVIGIAAGVILTFANVVARYIFNTGWSWAGEMTNYLFIWSAFFAAAYGFKKGIHISVTILVEKFPPAMAKFSLIIANIITTGFLIFISFYCIKYMLVLHEIDYTSIDLGVPLWIPMSVIPISFLLASFRAGEKLYEISQMPANDVIKNLTEEMIHDTTSAAVQDGEK